MIKLGILLVLLFFIVAVACKNEEANLANAIWDNYKSHLYNMIRSAYPENFSSNRQMHFAIATSPDEASWIDDRENLQNYFASHPIKHDGKFLYISRTADNAIPELYKNATLACEALEQFLKFSKANVDYVRGAKSYPWEEVGETLKEFLYRAEAGETKPVKTNILNEKSSFHLQHYVNNKETNRVSLSNLGSFAKFYSFQMKKQVDKFSKLSEGTPYAYNKRRPVYNYQWAIATKDIFQMQFHADGLAGIEVQPGPWFDMDWIQSGDQCLKPIIGKDKPLNMIPRIAWVAYRPQIKLVMAKGEWKQFQSVWENPHTYLVKFGGVAFRTPGFRKFLSDNPSYFNQLSESHQEFYEDNTMYSYHQDTLKAVPIPHSESSSEIITNAKLRTIEESLYSVTISSSSPFPEIVAVSSHILDDE